MDLQYEAQSCQGLDPLTGAHLTGQGGVDQDRVCANCDRTCVDDTHAHTYVINDCRKNADGTPNFRNN